MKTVILEGGMGTRLAEETDNHPKPMVKIGAYRSSMIANFDKNG
ncbi:MAG: sugar phosphate nucleotidyltransferase [Desulfomonilaceae bacterium]